ncbi:MAG: carboxypeptidase-like regulatory domain-containing protein [Thermoanaerobaculia bacterium]
MGSSPIFTLRRASAIFSALTLFASVRSAGADVVRSAGDPSLFPAGPAIDAETSATPSEGVEGRVLLRESPVSDARVYAYQLVEKSLHKVLTDGSGRFLFEALPAGIYKLIAHKAGLQPAVMLLQRDAPEASQFVELQLTEQAAPELTDFWTARSEIPADVLREIELSEGVAAGSAGSAGSDGSVVTASTAPGVADLVIASGSAIDSRVLGEVSAASGFHDVTPNTSALLAGANVGLRGQLGRVKLAMQGDFQTFETAFVAPIDAGLGLEGQTHSVSLNLQTPGQGDFDISSSSNRLVSAGQRIETPVEASRLYFRWNKPVGDGGTTTVRASYVDENGLYNRASIDPLGLPVASRTLRVEGNYARKMESIGNLTTGLRYSETSGDFAQRNHSGSSALPDIQALDAYGDAGWQANSRVLVQYGIFGTLRNGLVSITPRGGFVLQMGPLWQTSITGAHRVVSKDTELTDNVLPMVLDGTMSCGEADSACYQIEVQRAAAADEQLSLGASYRELDDTIRMYFNGNFFDSSEGIFLVSGDQLPELHASLRQRLTPGIVVKVSASVADGGGGIFRSVNRRFYENQVSMASSAIDATFEKTSTGVYLSFHRLDQELQPLRGTQGAGDEPGTDLERLDLVVSQNLSAIWDLSLDWAVNVGMGLARGASFVHSDVDSDAIQRRVMTGVAVRF